MNQLRAAVTLALRFLFPPPPRRLRRIKSAIIAIGIGLVPLIVVYQVAEGMIQGITARFIETGTYHLQIVARSIAADEEQAQLIASIQDTAGVRGVFRELQGLGLIAGSGGTSGVTIRALEPDVFERDPVFRSYLRVESGELRLDGADSVIIGRALARRVGAEVGDTVRLLTVRYGLSANLIPRVTRFTVQAIISTGYDELDRLWTIVPYDIGSVIMPSGSSRRIVGVKVDDPFTIANPLIRRSSRAVPDVLSSVRAQAGPLWRVFSWFELERGQYLSFVSTQQILTLIMILIVAVAAVNITSTLFLLVSDKSQEVAMLKSTGTPPAVIRWCFIICGAIIGAIGAFVGIAVGILAAVSVNEIFTGIEWVLNTVANFGASIVPTAGPPDQVQIFNPDFYLDRIPIHLRAQPFVITGIATVLLAAAAAWLPAHRAARLRPLEVFRRY